MIKLHKGRSAFWHFCPGCNDHHPIPHGQGRDWKFNGDFDKPTFSPSVLQHPHKTGTPADWRMTKRCHYFIKDGRIEFCGDSEHELAGQTVDLPDFELPAFLRE